MRTFFILDNEPTECSVISINRGQALVEYDTTERITTLEEMVGRKWWQSPYKTIKKMAVIDPDDLFYEGSTDPELQSSLQKLRTLQPTAINTDDADLIRFAVRVVALLAAHGLPATDTAYKSLARAIAQHGVPPITKRGKR